MGQDASTGSAEVTGARGAREPEQIQREIEETRGRLGDTVEALAAKADVKARAKEKIVGAKTSASEQKEQLLHKAREASPAGAISLGSQAAQIARANPLPVAAVGAFAAGFAAARLTTR